MLDDLVDEGDEDVIDSEDIALDLELQEALEGSSGSGGSGSGSGGNGKDRGENAGMDDFWSSSPAGKMDPKYKVGLL